MREAVSIAVNSFDSLCKTSHWLLEAIPLSFSNSIQ